MKNIIQKQLEIGDRFNIAFPDERVPNGFIDKTKTRLGITYTNFHDVRNSITILPSVGIIEDAMAHYPYLNLFEVKEKIDFRMIAEELMSTKSVIRLVTTPESFGKIIYAAQSIDKLDWLYNNFFLYLDEVHCYATDDYRDGILTPFDNEDVWKFTNMAMGTATAFQFSDPRICKMQHYKIQFHEKFGKVTIVNNHDPKAVLNHMLMNPDMFPGRVYIFYNSVTAIGEAISLAGITDVNVYCRDERKNMENLGEAKVFYRDRPINDEYAKFNFFSTRYNEGWNLEDNESATIILVTDVNKQNTLVGIPFKGFQAVGRLNCTPHKIYHVTNNLGLTSSRTFSDIQQQHLFNQQSYISLYNEHIDKCKAENIEDDGLLGKMITPFSKIVNGYAVRYPMKQDQIICGVWCKEHYNNLKTIQETWETVNYDTELEFFDLPVLETVNKSLEEINRQIAEQLEDLRVNKDKYNFGIITKTLNALRNDYPIVVEAYYILGIDEVRALNYNNKAMKSKLSEISNNNSEAKLRLLLIEEFKLHKRYIGSEIKQKLQSFYDRLNITKPDGKPEIATIPKLKEMGLFELHPCKVKDAFGVLKPGFEITKVNYVLKIAA